jgi:hypothetical protein
VIVSLPQRPLCLLARQLFQASLSTHPFLRSIGTLRRPLVCPRLPRNVCFTMLSPALITLLTSPPLWAQPHTRYSRAAPDTPVTLGLADKSQRHKPSMISIGGDGDTEGPMVDGDLMDVGDGVESLAGASGLAGTSSTRPQATAHDVRLIKLNCRHSSCRRYAARSHRRLD